MKLICTTDSDVRAGYSEFARECFNEEQEQDAIREAIGTFKIPSHRLSVFQGEYNDGDGNEDDETWEYIGTVDEVMSHIHGSGAEPYVDHPKL
jgi:hypothetical protein